MKKLLTLLLTLFLFSSVYAGERIIDKLEYRSGIAYAENEDEPYTGKVVERHLNGKKFLEYGYKKGIQEGLEIEWRESGTKEYERNYKNGEKEGLFTMWYPNGQKHYSANYTNGEKEGLLTRWLEDGQIDFQQNYSGGTRLGSQITTFNTKTGEVNELEPKSGGAHVSSEKTPFSGKLIQYHDNGNKKLEEHWELTGNVWPSPNRKTYKATYYANGQKASETTYKKAAGQREIFWYENGNKEHETTYENGYKHGVETYWYENGYKAIETHWESTGKVWPKPSQKTHEIKYYYDGTIQSEIKYDINGIRLFEIKYDSDGVVTLTYQKKEQRTKNKEQRT